MPRNEILLRAGGAAGDGIASLGDTLGRTCVRSGLYTAAFNHYQSVIRGGHVWYHIRAMEEQVKTGGDSVDVLIALDQLTIDTHARWMGPDSVIIYDPAKTKVTDEHTTTGTKGLGVPLAELAKKFATLPIMRNTVAAGAALYLTGLPRDITEEMLKEAFGRKGEDVVNANLSALGAGFEFASQNLSPLDIEVEFSRKSRLLMSGNEAVGLGAVASGCRFAAQYPMTPASPIMHWIAAHASKYNVVFKQAEDELAAINLAIGANFAGLRAMTATSGGGFALMTEAFGMAGMTETPLVVAEVMRAGPSTGVPTKTEQADFDMVKGASQGEFPRVIIAPGDVEDCYTVTTEAFNIAERYQVPVIILSDLYLGEHWETVDPEAIDLEPEIDRSATILEDIPESDRPYLRYKYTDNGVSPRSVPGVDGGQHVAGTDEHDEHANLISDVFVGLPDAIETRKKQVEKRMGKLDHILAEFPAPQIVGDPDADLTLISWGSTKAVIDEAAATLNANGGPKVNTLHLRHLWPFPADKVASVLNSCKKTMIVEANYTGQIERLIREQTGLTIDHNYRKYDGEPFYPNDILKAVGKVI